MKHSYDKYYIKDLQDEINKLTDKVERLEGEKEKYRKIIDGWIKASSDMLGYQVTLKGYK